MENNYYMTNTSKYHKLVNKGILFDPWLYCLRKQQTNNNGFTQIFDWAQQCLLWVQNQRSIEDHFVWSWKMLCTLKHLQIKMQLVLKSA